MPPKNVLKTDIILVGGGPVGFVFAATIAQQAPDARVALVERQDLGAVSQAHTPDHRTTTLSAHTCELFETLGLWPALGPQAVAIQDITVNDQNAPNSALCFQSKDVGKPFGYTINNTYLRAQLNLALKALPNLTIFDKSAVAAVERRDAHVCLTTTAGQAMEAPLLVGADGRLSQIRQHFNFSFSCKPYFQQALVGLVDHETPHQGLAFESFYPTGPVAFLPHKDSQGSHSTSALVFCGPPHSIQGLLNNPLFALSLCQERAPAQFGRLKKLYNLQSYPLEIGRAKRAYQERVVLIGDAAQYMHPVAGQGMNLGIRDAKTLATHLASMAKLGLDIGAETVLAAYQKKRQPDVLPMLGFTHGLIRLFGLSHPGAQLARRLGFQLVGRLPSAKRFFAKRAMGYEAPFL